MMLVASARSAAEAPAPSASPASRPAGARPGPVAAVRLRPARLSLLIQTLLLATGFGVGGAPVERAMADSDLHGQLAELAARFSWAPVERQAPVVGITVTGDPGGDWHLVPRAGGDVELRGGPAAAAGFTCELDAETVGRLYRGEISGMTAAGKATGEEASPLEILPGSAVPEDAPRSSLGPVFHFIAHFWNRGEPEIISMSGDHSRVLAGANIVGLFYHPGFRSAWYSVSGEESLNKEGDASPYPQAYVVVRGQARVRYGHRWVEVAEGEAIYIPPGTIHAVRSRDSAAVEVLWLAWGEGA
jgi:mannose-6-phosphate isomerase-like protein (cupin superfamily)